MCAVVFWYFYSTMTSLTVFFFIPFYWMREYWWECLCVKAPKQYWTEHSSSDNWSSCAPKQNQLLFLLSRSNTTSTNSSVFGCVVVSSEWIFWNWLLERRGKGIHNLRTFLFRENRNWPYSRILDFHFCRLSFPSVI